MATNDKNNAKATWIKRVLSAVLVAAGLGLLVFAWIPKPVPVDLALVEQGRFRITVDEEGRTRVKDRYVVSAPLFGNLARISLQPGDTIKAGEVLARIVPLDPPLLDARAHSQAKARVAAARAGRAQAQASVERSKAALSFAKKELARFERLASSGGVSVQELDRARLEERTAREQSASSRFGAQVAGFELQMAQAALGRLSHRGAEPQMEVQSPVGGQVLRLIRESGGAVQAGTPLIELGDPSTLEVVVDVLTSDAVKIRAGQKVAIDSWGGDALLHGRVRNVEPSAFTRVSALGVDEQRVNVIIDIDETREQRAPLGDGYRIEAHIVIEEIERALHVPSSAVFRHEGGWAVFKYVDERALLTPVEVGHRNGPQVHVSSGLRTGDRVVLHPSDRVRHEGSIVARDRQSNGS